MFPLVGDLKPENLLLADNNENSLLKIADFGLSALFRNGIFDGSSNEYRRLKSVVGSPHYVAPEVLNDGSEGYDPSVLFLCSLMVLCVFCVSARRVRALVGACLVAFIIVEVAIDSRTAAARLVSVPADTRVPLEIDTTAQRQMFGLLV